MCAYDDPDADWDIEGFAQFNVYNGLMHPLAEAAVSGSSAIMGAVTLYYDFRLKMINDMDDNMALTRTYFHAPQGAGRAAHGHVDGANPASGAYRDYTQDRTAALGCGDPGGAAQSAAGVG